MFVDGIMSRPSAMPGSKLSEQSFEGQCDRGRGGLCSTPSRTDGPTPDEELQHHWEEKS